MERDSKNDPIETFLGGFEPLPLDAESRHRLAAPTGSAPTAASSSFFPMILAAAALLLMLGGLWWKLSGAPDTDGANAAETAAIKIAKDAFFVIETQPDASALLAQNCDDFQVRRAKINDTLGKYSLAAVSETSVSLRDDKGAVIERSVQAINKATADELARECEQYQALANTGGLREEHLHRLQDLVSCGQPEAIRILESLSTTSIASQSEASEKHASEMQEIAAAHAWALRGSKQARMSAIASLGSSKSPVAMHALRSLALELSDATLAESTVNALSTAWKSRALPALDEIAGAAASPEARAAAAAKGQSLRKEMNRE